MVNHRFKSEELLNLGTVSRKSPRHMTEEEELQIKKCEAAGWDCDRLLAITVDDTKQKEDEKILKILAERPNLRQHILTYYRYPRKKSKED